MGESPAADKDFRVILSRKMWTPSRLPVPTIGIHRWPSPGCRRASMFMWKSLAATIPLKDKCWWRRSRSLGKLVQMGTQQRSSPHTIEVIQKIREGVIGRPYLAKAWYSNVRKSIGTGKEVPDFRRSLTGNCGKARRHVVPIRTTFIRTTGTGLETTAPAKRSIMERTRWMSAGGRWASTIRNGSLRRAADTNSRTTGSFTTRW